MNPEYELNKGTPAPECLSVVLDQTTGIMGPCTRIIGSTCSAYAEPAVKWKNGRCPLAPKLIETKERKKVNPLKASKKAKKRG